MRRIVEGLKTEGKRVVFTNGCFDLLHVGHVRYLEQAKALGDILIVGINSDRSVQDLKGPLRPILPVEDRAEILSGLGCIDYITVFDEPTPLELITLLKPMSSLREAIGPKTRWWEAKWSRSGWQSGSSSVRRGIFDFQSD